MSQHDVRLLSSFGSRLWSNSARGSLLFVGFFQRSATLGTDADYPQQVLGDLEAVFCSHRVLDGLQLRRKEFDDPAALRTDHMIVMLVFVVVFVVGDAVTKANFARKPGFGEQFQRPVNGGLADAWIFLFDQAVEIFTGKMSFRPQKDIENQVALAGALEALLLDMVTENFLLFSHLLGRISSGA